MKTLDQQYKTLETNAPFHSDPTRRAAYLEQCVKHMMSLAKHGCKTERIVHTAEEAIGWLTPFETEFAVDALENAQGDS